MSKKGAMKSSRERTVHPGGTERATCLRREYAQSVQETTRRPERLEQEELRSKRQQRSESATNPVGLEALVQCDSEEHCPDYQRHTQLFY